MECSKIEIKTMEVIRLMECISGRIKMAKIKSDTLKANNTKTNSEQDALSHFPFANTLLLILLRTFQKYLNTLMKGNISS